MAVQHPKNGFTLVELLIGTVVMGILVLAVGLILIMPIRTMRTNTEYATLRRDIAFAVQLLAKDIRKAPFDATAANYGMNLLVLPGRADLPDLWPDTVEYKINDGSGNLHRYVAGEDRGVVIPKGLTSFSTQLRLDDEGAPVPGVALFFKLQNGDGDIVIDHETFIHARN